MPELRFGSYALVRRLAVGGMAEVFLAERSLPNAGTEQVVVKQILPQLAEEPELLQLFYDEARIASRLSHPGIVSIKDFGQQEGIHYLVMEYVDGLDLSKLLRFCREQLKAAGVPIDCSVRIGIDLSQALDYAHSAKDEDGNSLEIVHRDVSPQNVLFSRRGELKLGDFGIARASIRARRTATGVLRGKIAYVSPEQYFGRRGDRRVDVYAIGVVLFEIIAGRRPFAGQDAAVIKQIMTEDAPPLHALVPQVPRALSDIVAKALARQPNARFATAAELAGALDALGLAAPRASIADLVVRAMEKRKEEIRTVRSAAPRVTETIGVVPSEQHGGGETVAGSLSLTENAEPSEVKATRWLVPSSGEAKVSADYADEAKATVIREEPEWFDKTTAAPGAMAAEPTRIGAPLVEPLPAEGTATFVPPQGGPKEGTVTYVPPEEAVPDTVPPPTPIGAWRVAKVAVVLAGLMAGIVAAYLGTSEEAVVTVPVTAQDREIVELAGTNKLRLAEPAQSGEPTAMPRPGGPDAVQAVPGAEEQQETSAERIGQEADPKSGEPELSSKRSPDESPAEGSKRKADRKSALSKKKRVRTTRGGSAEPGRTVAESAAAPKEEAPSKEAASKEGASKEVAAKETAPRESPPVLAPSGATGDLSIDSHPWSYVRVGRKDLGVTPLAHVRLPAGRHRVQLSNPDQRIERVVVLEIPANEEVAVRVDLKEGRVERR